MLIENGPAILIFASSRSGGEETPCCDNELMVHLVTIDTSISKACSKSNTDKDISRNRQLPHAA